ncbi:MAG: hypothetical protein IRZ11_05660 [Clostridia bacterium]|nr:hypothetical protein [Clostridia bacterium]
MEPDVLLLPPASARSACEGRGLAVRVTWVDERRDRDRPAAWRVVRAIPAGDGVELLAAAFPKAEDGALRDDGRAEGVADG